jgi:hypothetical protein
MITSFQVVDGLCERIDEVVHSAHDSGFSTWLPNKGQVGSSIYEGMNFVGSHALMLHALSIALGGPILPNKMFFRITNKDTERAYIHSDRSAGNHTCVAYLSEHADETGTAFWRHRRTGLSYMPTFEDQKKSGIFEELKADMVSGDPEKWERTDFVRAVKNRALIFQAPLFHSRWPLEGFGEGEGEQGRLVHVVHFFKLNAQGGLF